MGRPMELIEGEVTGLPFPARSEIVLEGWILPERDDRAKARSASGTAITRARRADEPPIRIERDLPSQRSDPHVRGEPEAAALAPVRALLPALGGAARLARRRRASPT